MAADAGGGVVPRHSPYLTSSLLTSDPGVSVLVAFAYFVGCVVGFLVRFPSSGIAYVWPPNAILLVSLLLVRRRAWPAILAAAGVAHGVAHTLDGVPVLVWLVLFLGNSAQAVLGASVMLHFSPQPSRWDDTLRRVLVFVGGAAVAAPVIASLFPAYVYVKIGWASDYWSAWGMRTLTNVVTTITLVPPAMAILGEGRRGLSGVTLARAGEFLLVLVALFAVNVAAFAFAGATQGGIPPLLYACIPLLAWASIRFGLPGLSICLLMLAIVSINTPLRSSPQGNRVGVETIVAVQLFVTMWVSPLMFISAALAERRAARRSEAALQRSEAKNAAILRAVPDWMFVLTKDDHRYLDYYCPNATELLASPQDFLGRRMRDVLPADLARSFEKCFARAATSREPTVFEYSLPMHDEHRFYEARVVACDDDRLLSIVRDITERKQAEAALRTAQQALAHLSRATALGELAASIAHEVRQPLAAIAINAAACLRMLEQEAADSRKLTEALADIVESSRRATDVIERVRELFSDSPRRNVRIELNATIVEVLALTRDRAERNGVPVRTELETAPLVVMGDRVQLQQVLVNLVMNGLDAMSGVTGADRALVIQSWRENGSVHVAVRDGGPGFDPDEIDRLFDPFYTTKPDGLGMGLAISRSIVRAHGGTLEARRNSAGGATFEFTVPAAPDTTAGTAAAD